MVRTAPQSLRRLTAPDRRLAFTRLMWRHDRGAASAWLAWCSLLATLLFVAATSARGAGVGSPAPACGLASLGTRPATETQQFRGRVVYLDFWASWCGPCAQAFPFMNALQKEFGERGLAVVGVNVDETPSDALRFLQKIPATFTIGADASGACPRAFGVDAMPSSYLIDRSGVIRYVHSGFRAGDAAELRRRVDQLLREASTAPSPR